VVDDEDTVRQVAKTSLERFGYRVLLAANGIEAVEILARAPD
jgi:CheY-like chemotaxis protein